MMRWTLALYFAQLFSPVASQEKDSTDYGTFFDMILEPGAFYLQTLKNS